jgi:FkbM family methyltransferase
MFWFIVAKIYIKIYGICRDRFGVTLRGMGFVLRLVHTDRVLDVAGKKLYFNHNVAACYNRLVNGEFNEPETHIFLKRLFESFKSSTIFVDVGANIGEMIVDVARYPNVMRVLGFEPNAECVKACRQTSDLNNYRHVQIVEKVMNADGAPVSLFADATPLASSIVDKGNRSEIRVDATTIDAELLKFEEPAVILIDVEGAEALVLQGGKRYIEAAKPLIIFEYNHVSKKFFSLETIHAILGETYSLFRLRHDGSLDQSFEKTWNCVAVSSDSVFFKACQSFIAN